MPEIPRKQKIFVRHAKPRKMKRVSAKIPIPIERIPLAPQTAVTKQNFFSFFSPEIPNQIMHKAFEIAFSSGPRSVPWVCIEAVNRLFASKKSGKPESFSFIAQGMIRDGFLISPSRLGVLNKKTGIYSQADLLRFSSKKTGGARERTPQELVEKIVQMHGSGLNSGEVYRQLLASGKKISLSQVIKITERHS